MAYSTPAMVRLALVPTGDGSQPATPSNTAADLTDPQLADHIAEADSIINGYLRRLYTMPVQTLGGPPAIAPEPVSYWSRDIAAYLATCTYRGSLDFGDDDPVVRRYKAAMGMLRDTGAGKMALDIPVATGVGTTAEGSAGPPVNPYSGDLWQPADFDLGVSNEPNADGTWRPPFYPYGR